MKESNQKFVPAQTTWLVYALGSGKKDEQLKHQLHKDANEALCVISLIWSEQAAFALKLTDPGLKVTIIDYLH